MAGKMKPALTRLRSPELRAESARAVCASAECYSNRLSFDSGIADEDGLIRSNITFDSDEDMSDAEDLQDLDFEFEE